MQNSVMEFVLQTSGFDKAQAELNSLSRGAAQVVSSVNRLSAASSSGIGPAQGFENAVKKQSQSLNELTTATNNDSRARSNWFAHIAKTTVLSAIVNKSFLALTDSMAAATKQIDLIENFPGAMGALGISADDASVSFQKLREYVQGVGGDIAEATSAVSRFTQVNKNVQASVALYAGVNNALIAGGAAAEAQAAALEQLVQGYSRGRFEGEEWRSMATSMSLAMNEAAKALDQPSTQALQKALVDGEVSMNSFMSTLASVSTGTGPVAQAAMAQMQGIGFATTVMSNTLTNGLTAIYQAVGRQNIIAFFNLLTGVIATLASWAVTLINILISLFNFLSGLFGGPQISNLAGESQAVANNLGAGASAAEGIGNGLDDAGKSAKKLNKQLAGFDKMNVLQDKESGSGGKAKGAGGGAGTPGEFNAGELGKLKNIFDGISGGLQDASIWAKILAGIIAGIAGIKFAQSILDQLNSLGKTASTTRGNFAKLRDGLLNLPVVVAGGFNKAMAPIAAFGKLLLTPIGIIATIAAAFVALYFTNEEFKKGFDSVWLPIIEVLKEVGKIILGGIAIAFEAVSGWLKQLGIDISGILPDFKLLAEMDMKQIGKSIGGIAAIIGTVLVVKISLAIARFTILTATGVASATKTAGAWIVQSGKMLAVIISTVAQSIARFVALGIAAVAPAVSMGTAWVVNTAKAIGQLVLLSTAMTVNAIKMAASWVIAMGPLAWIGAAVVALVALIILNWDTVKQWMADFWAWLKQVASDAWNGIKSVWSKAVEWFKNLWNGIVAVFSVVGAWFKDTFQKAWNGIVEIWNKIPEWFGNIWNGIKNIFSVVGTWFKDKFSAAWNGIKSIWSAVSKWFSGVWNEIKKIFADPLGYFKGKFQAAWDGIKGIWSGVKKFFEDKWKDIKSAFSLSKLKTLGKDVVEGLWNGINSMASWIGEKIKGFGEGVLNGIKDFFGIHSPSRVMRDQVGKMLGIGMAEGITDSTKEAVSAAETAADSVMGVFSDMGTSMGNIQSDFTTSSMLEGGFGLTTSTSSLVDIDDVAINDESWIDSLATRLARNGQPAQIVVQIGEDKITDKMIDLINDKTYMTGRNAIYV